MIGEKLSPVLEEIETTIWEFDANVGLKPGYTDGGFRAGIKIFMSVFMDKIWELQQNEGMAKQDCLNMAQKAGEDLRNLIKTYTDIDCHNLYK